MEKKGVTKEAAKLNELLIENFVNLQKAITNLSVRFENMSEQISKLLSLFEISARSFSEKLSVNAPEMEKDKEFLEKLDKLLEQNKVIAKGITLMEEKVRERVEKTTPSAEIPKKPAFLRFAPQNYQASSLERESA